MHTITVALTAAAFVLAPTVATCLAVLLTQRTIIRLFAAPFYTLARTLRDARRKSPGT